MTRKMPVGGPLAAAGTWVGLLVVSGIFLVLHTLLMDRESLQDPWIPIHLGVVGIVGAVLYSAAAAGARTGEILGLAAASFAVTGLSGAFASKGAFLVSGWAILGAWGARILVRGGDR